MPCGRVDDLCADTAETARRVPSFDAMRECESVGVILAVFRVCSGPAGEVSSGG